MFLTLRIFLPYILYIFFFFFFNDTATTEIYTLSLHDALPISLLRPQRAGAPGGVHRHRRAELQAAEGGARLRRKPVGPHVAYHHLADEVPVASVSSLLRPTPVSASQTRSR